MVGLLLPLLATLHLVQAISTPSTQLLHRAQGINLWKLQRAAAAAAQHAALQQTTAQTPLIGNSLPSLSSSSLLSPYERKYPALYFEQPLDHFDSAEKSTFQQRYWVDARFYKPGGPVFVLDGGETSGVDRLPFLDHGILAMYVADFPLRMVVSVCIGG